MTWRRELAKLGALFRRRKPVDDLAEEIRTHLEMEEEKNREAGMPPDEAHYAALRQFGNVTRVQEECREMWGWNFLESLGQDIRFGLRMLAKNPGFTAVAVVTLALGIGGNTATFSLLNALFFRSLPLQHANRVVELYRGERSWPLSYQDYLEFRDRSQAFSGLAAEVTNESALEINGSSEVILAEGVSGNYASVLGVKAFLGRWFSAEDERMSPGQFLAVVSYRVWQTRLGGDPHVLGRQVRLESQWYTVIGVATKDFQGMALPAITDLYVPLVMYGQHNEFIAQILKDRRRGNVRLLGRLRADVTPAQAQAEANTIDVQMQREYPREEASEGPLRAETIRGISDPGFRHTGGQVATLLMCVTGLVLLIACVNIATLLLVRGTLRHREMSIRLALGASRVRIIRQVMVESLLLALMGTVAGLLIVNWASPLIENRISSAPLPIPIGINLAIDGPLLGFAVGVAILTTLFFGVVPALHSSKPNLVTGLKDAEGMPRARVGRLTFRNLYVVAQVAFSFMLIIIAGLFIRALQKVNRINPGFDPRGLLSLRLYIAKPDFTAATGITFYHRVEERVLSLPGVQSASLSYTSPFLTMTECVAPQGAPNVSRSTLAGSNIVGTDYFSTLGIPLLRGRNFTPYDNAQALPVVIVNDVLARRYWPGQNPIGRRLRVGDGCDKGQGKIAEIVGMARDAKYDTMDHPAQPYIFFPFDQHFVGYVAWVVRMASNAVDSPAMVRKEVLEIDRRVKIFEVETISDQIEKSHWQVRWETWVVGMFGVLALLLAAIGLYGVIAYEVGQRTREIGIRVALGANRRDILHLVLGNGLALTLMGITLGLALSLALTRLLRGFLFGLSPTDDVTFLASSLLWIVLALLASYIPARRATKVDPMVALRYE